MTENPAVASPSLYQAFDQAPGFICTFHGPDHVFTFVNAAHRRLFGSGDFLGRSARDAFADLKGQGFFEALDRVFTTGEQYTASGALVRYRRSRQAPFEEHFVDFIFAPMRDAGDQITGIFCEGFEVTERVQTERLGLIHNRMLALAVEERAPDDALSELVRLVEEQGGYGLLGSVLLLAPDRRHLKLAAAPNLPPSYNARINGIAIGEAVGSCGTAVFRREPVYVRDIATDPLWTDYRELAAAHGLRACWSVPIRNGENAVVGAFAFYYPDVRSPSEADHRVAELAARSAALIVDRGLVREAMHRRTAQLQAVAEAALTVARAPTLDATLQEITDACRRIIGVHQVVVSLTRGSDWSQAMSAVALTEKYAGWRNFNELPDGSGIYALVCANNRPMRMTQEELEMHTAWRGFGDHSDRHPPMRGWLAAPLVARDGRNLGLIQVTDRQDGGEFDEADEAMLVQFALVGSAAIEQASMLEELRKSEARYEAITNSIDQLIWATRPDGYHDFYNARWYEYTGVPFGSTDGEEWNAMFHPEDRELAWAVWQKCLQTGEPYHIEYRLRHRSGQYRWVIGRAQAVRDMDGRIVRWFGTCTDVHDLKVAEEQRELIARELSHRIKNIFAVVSSILTLSARGFPEARDYANAVRARLDALGIAHEYVRPHGPESRPPEEATTVHGLLRALLKPYDNSAGARFTIAGCDAHIGTQAATGLSLVIHELATNAVKYGALASPDGHVKIGCDTVTGQFRLRWQELGGPAVMGPPIRTGFGSTLAERVAMANFGARIEREWCREGLIVNFISSYDSLEL
nr:PAS domain S-box protein [Rhizobium sp. TCK]CAD6630244.1 PAS domain S-box protein [arsenite-oxidising bacterium NT-25]